MNNPVLGSCLFEELENQLNNEQFREIYAGFKIIVKGFVLELFEKKTKMEDYVFFANNT